MLTWHFNMIFAFEKSAKDHLLKVRDNVNTELNSFNWILCQQYVFSDFNQSVERLPAIDAYQNL